MANVKQTWRVEIVITTTDPEGYEPDHSDVEYAIRQLLKKSFEFEREKVLKLKAKRVGR